MIHQYKLGGFNIVLDVCSGSVHVVDEVAYDIIGQFEEKSREEVLVAIAEAHSGISSEEIAECYAQVESLKNSGKLFAPDTFAQVDKKTNMPHNSSIFSLFMCAVWFVYFIFLGSGLFDFGKISEYAFDSSELPIITLYAFYIPILLAMMIKEKELDPFKRFALPSISLVSIGLIITACIIKHGVNIIWYLIIFAAIMLAGMVAQKYNEKKHK